MRILTVKVSHDTDELEDEFLEAVQEALQLIVKCSLNQVSIEISSVEDAE